MAFKAKDLHFEKQEPAFLRRLRGEVGGDRHNVQFARPKKDRLNTGDDDDGPIMVDESGVTIDKEDYEAMVAKGAAKGGSDGADGDRGVVVENEQVIEDGRVEQQPEKQKVAVIGGPRKRKAIKVVGEDLEDTEVIKGKLEARGIAESKADKLVTAKAKPVKTMKAKKVKLSFEDSVE